MISSSVSVVSLPEYFLIMSSLVVGCFLGKLLISLLVSVLTFQNALAALAALMRGFQGSSEGISIFAKSRAQCAKIIKNKKKLFIFKKIIKKNYLIKKDII